MGDARDGGRRDANTLRAPPLQLPRVLHAALIVVEWCLVRKLSSAAPVPQDFESFRSTSPAGFGLLAVNETTMVWEQFNAKTGAALDSHVYHR